MAVKQALAKAWKTFSIPISKFKSHMHQCLFYEQLTAIQSNGLPKFHNILDPWVTH